MAPIKLYGFEESPPTRAVKMCLDYLNVPYELVFCHPAQGHTRTPEFLKMNPMHAAPTMDDNGFVLTESRAMLMYLAEKYGSNRTGFWPSDEAKRARIQARIHFDAGNFYPSVFNIFFPTITLQSAEIPQDKLDTLKETLKWVSDMVRSGYYVAKTRDMTPADIAFMATWGTLLQLNLAETKNFPHIDSWFKKCKAQLPHYESAGGLGSEEFGVFYRAQKARCG